MRSIFRFLAASAMLVALPSHAEPAGTGMTDASQKAGTLTLERVFASPSLAGATPMGVKLSPDGRTLSLLRNRPDDAERYDLWGFDRGTGQWRMLVDSLKLSSGRALSEAEKMQRERKRIGNLKGVVSYEWAPDGKAVLVPLDGDLFLAGLDGKAHPIAGAAGGVLNPALSPKGGKLAFVRDRRVWITPVAAGSAPVAITPEETAETVHWGEAEFVAQEEMNRMVGFWWSPEGNRLAVERFDEAGVGIVTRAAIGAEGTKTYDQRYPAAGTPNAEVSLWVVGADGQGRVKVDLGSDKDIYLARVDWAPDGKTLYVQRENRAQTRLDMLSVDPATGASHVLFTENAAEKSWINLSDSYRFLKDGSLLWWSERDGFGHLYLFKPRNHPESQWTQLTSGDWVVTGLVGVDQKAGRVTFSATKDGVLEGQIYALDLAQPGRIERITERGFDNNATMDGAGQTLLVTRSADAQPPQSYVADANGKRLAWIEQNKVEGSHPYAPYLASHRPAQFGTITSPDGKTPLHWVMITPPMEPGKQYPVFTYHYGGPHSRVVNAGWQGALAQAVVDKGYIWFAIDNRGSDDRGVAFESTIWHAMGSVEVEDQFAGLNYLKTLPYVDPKRISTFGWSYGGYMTIKMLEAHPGAWAAGIAVAPVTKWQIYDTHYTERYLGDPREVPQVYEKSNALADTAKIVDPLLVVHGMADDNVVFENATAFVAKMQGEAVPFEMMFYPGFTHRISGPKVSPHLYETMFRFLDRNGAGSRK
jgi:dipeptidyl-peptidase-4